LLPAKAKVTGLDDPQKPNILIVIYDALTATQMSLHGYDRETTPNINRLAEKAIVYHQHYAGGHWTYPGTMSLLTGVLPWTHRGFIHGPRIASPFDIENIFTLFNDYHTMAYTHNYVAEDVLKILQWGIDQLIPKPTLYTHKSFFLHDILGDDFDIATLSKQRILNNENEGYASSLFLTHLVEWINGFRERELRENFLVPPKVSGSGDLFLLEEATDWILEQSKDLPRPYLSYIHLFPPHEPYIVRKDFADAFQDDGFVPVRKPTHFFTEIKFSSYEETDELRLAYNQALR
jgi:hypothetical protein